MGRELRAGRKPTAQQARQARQPTTQNLFVACLPKNITNDILLELFQPFDAKTATVMMHTNGTSKGFGFVIFDSEQDGKKAMDAMNEKPTVTEANPNGFQMKCNPSNYNPKTVVSESQYVFIRNIPSSVSMGELRSLFSEFGTVVHMSTKEDEHSVDGTFLLLMIEYKQVEEAKKAIKAVHGNAAFADHSSTPLMAKFADPAAVNKQQKRRGSCTTPQRSPASRSLQNSRPNSPAAMHLSRSTSPTTTPLSPYTFGNPPQPVALDGGNSNGSAGGVGGGNASPPSPAGVTSGGPPRDLGSTQTFQFALPRALAPNPSSGEQPFSPSSDPDGSGFYTSGAASPTELGNGSESFADYEYPAYYDMQNGGGLRRISISSNGAFNGSLTSSPSRRVSISSTGSGYRPEVGDGWFRNDPYGDDGYVKSEPPLSASTENLSSLLRSPPSGPGSSPVPNVLRRGSDTNSNLTPLTPPGSPPFSK